MTWDPCSRCQDRHAGMCGDCILDILSKKLKLLQDTSATYRGGHVVFRGEKWWSSKILEASGKRIAELEAEVAHAREQSVKDALRWRDGVRILCGKDLESAANYEEGKLEDREDLSLRQIEKIEDLEERLSITKAELEDERRRNDMLRDDIEACKARIQD